MSWRLWKFVDNLLSTISGWRFDNLRDQISQLIEDAPKQIHLREIDRSRKSEIAFVSPLPPQDTGIATCSFYSISNFPVNIDLFTPSPNQDWTMALEIKSNPTRDTVHIYGTDQFLALDSLSSYKVIIIAIGNSDHHAYVFDFLKKVGAFHTLDRVWLYVHDPIVLNLLQVGKSLSNGDLLQYIKRLYPDKDAGIDIRSMFSQKWGVHALFSKKSILGLRAFNSLGINKFLVNSKAAAEHLSKDLKDDAIIIKLFHPCFLPLTDVKLLETNPSISLRVGTFGIPGGSKMTKLIIEACERLHQAGHPVELFIAGYGVENFWKYSGFEELNCKYHLFDGATDIRLVEIMNGVDVAVQLRDQNWGESSGIIPQLLMLEKAVIVSDLGSFKEFGSAVSYFDNSKGVAELMSLILLAPNTKDVNLIKDYTFKHSVASFQEALVEKIISQ